MTKYTFIFEATASNLLGSSVIVYATSAFNATKEIIDQINIIRKASGASLITINVTDYNTINALITALNLLLDIRIIDIKNETSIWSLWDTTSEE